MDRWVGLPLMIHTQHERETRFCAEAQPTAWQSFTHPLRSIAPDMDENVPHDYVMLLCVEAFFHGVMRMYHTIMSCCYVSRHSSTASR
jgi:hypothetical protein